MHILTRFSLSKVPIIMLLILFVVLGGIYSAGQLKSELLPNIELPVVSVVTIYPGAAPDDVRRDVTEPIEKVLAGTANLKTITSTSNDSVSFLSAEYQYGTNMEKTQKTIEDAVNALTLPSQVQRPKVGRFSFQDIPVLAYTINTSDKSVDASVNLRSTLEQKLVPELKSISGVNAANVAGGGQKQVTITFDTQKLEKNGLQASAVTGILQANNVSFPTGEIVTGGQSIPVRIVNQFTSLDELRNLVVKPAVSGGSASGSGAAPGGPASGSPPAGGAAGGPPPGAGSASGSGGSAASKSSTPAPAVKLSDVAAVDLVNSGAETISRSNGKPSLSLIIYKTQNANTVQVADAVSQRVNELKAQLPGTETVVLFDQSTFIKDSLNGLIREGILGAILAIVVILLFLTSVKSTLVTAVSIPLSVLIALILLNVFNISLNIMSLAGLAVAIGRVVDDSIVVLENIYRHHFQRGESLRDAAYNGTKEVATAITASTITTVCVFLPLGFIAGLVSEFFRPFAVAVSVSLLASLVVALTVIPVLAMLFLKTGKARYREHAGGRAERDTLIQRVYTPAISWALKNGKTKAATLGFVVVLLVATGFVAPLLGFTFINFGSDKVLNSEVTMKPGTDLQTTSKAAAAIEAEIQKNPKVNNYQTTIGSDTNRASSGFGGGLGSAGVAKLTVTLARDADIKAEAAWLRNLIANQAKSSLIDDFSVAPGSGGGPSSSNFSAVVSGSNYDDVVKTSDVLVSKLKKVSDLVNVTSDAARAKPEIKIKVDPGKALAHGSTAIQIAGQVRNLLTSQKISQITLNGSVYDLQATYDQNTLNSLSSIKAIKVGAVNPVALGDIADVSMGNGPVSITRVNQERSVTVRGTIDSESTSGVNRDAQKAVNELQPGAGTKIAITGAIQQQAEAFGQLGVALVIAIFLVYIVMVLTFGSLSTPFVIMFSLPLAAIGSIFALVVTGRPLGISALIGVLMLVGIVVTNAIVLLDLVEQLKHRGFSTHDALVEGGRTRVRPIIMTALATMIALMPLVLGFSEGSIIASELGTVVVGGLFTSTFLTLIVVPVVYSLLDSFRHRLGGRRGQEEPGFRDSGDNQERGESHETTELQPAAPEPAGAS